MALLLRFMRFLTPYRAKGLAAGFFMLAAVGLQLPVPFLSRMIIDRVIVVKDLSLLNVICVAAAALILLNALSSFLQSFFLSVFRARVVFDIRVRLYQHIQRLSLRFFHARQSGYLLSRIGTDVQSLHGLLADTMVSLCQSAFTFIAGIACTLSLHPTLALLSFSLLPAYGATLLLFNRRVRAMAWEVSEAYANLQKDLQELFSGAFVIQSLNAEGWAALKMMRSAKKLLRRDVRLSVTNIVLVVASSVIAALGPLVVLWYGAAEVIRGTMTVGGLVAFTAFLHYLFGPTRVFVTINLSVQGSLASAKRVFEILDTQPEVKDGPEARGLESPAGALEFRNVTFAYATSQVLRKVSFRASPGTMVAIVGPSGAGKSTIVNLIQRLYDPQEGQVLVDGRDVRAIGIHSLRSCIGAVPQDVFLFGETIRENIKLNAKVEDAEIVEAARLARAHEFIERLPLRYLTVVGERGTTLSGGERQRISIARALLRDPRILIMDEATSQLDAESEKAIHEALFCQKSSRTIFMIAHRLSTVVSVDTILVIDNGELVAAGTHGELLESCPLYRTLSQTHFIR